MIDELTIAWWPLLVLVLIAGSFSLLGWAAVFLGAALDPPKEFELHPRAHRYVAAGFAVAVAVLAIGHVLLLIGTTVRLISGPA